MYASMKIDDRDKPRGKDRGNPLKTLSRRISAECDKNAPEPTLCAIGGLL